MKIPRIGPKTNIRPAGIHIEPKRREHRESQIISDGVNAFFESDDQDDEPDDYHDLSED